MTSPIGKVSNKPQTHPIRARTDPTCRSCPPAAGGGGRGRRPRIGPLCCPLPARDSALWCAPTPIRPLSTPHVMWAALGQRLHALYQPFHQCVERIPNPIRNNNMRSRRHSLTPFPRRGFRLLSSRHHRLKTFTKRTFLRWRALPLGRDLTRVRHDAMGFARSPSGSSLPLRYLEGLSGRQRRLIRPARPVWTSCLRHRRKGR